MRMSLSLRLVPILLVATLLAAATTASVQAAPEPQAATVTIIVLGFVDVFGGNDPDCPGCNGEFDPEDQDHADQDPLAAFTVIVRDASGAQIARETTQSLAGLQRVSIDVPEGAEFTVELEGDPAGWELCPNESPTRTLTSEDFQLGNALEEFHFWHGCASMPTRTPTTTGATATPRPTVTPGGPTLTPAPATPEPTEEPDEDMDEDEADEGAAEPEHAPLGSIRGLAFIDVNEDGLLGPDEPGLNDVGVHCHGGNVQLYQLTNGAGQFSFDGLGEGHYDVFIDPGPEWRVTTTSKYSAVHVVGGEAVLGIDFGMVRDGAAADSDLVVQAPGSGIRLPDTGIADVSPNQLVVVMALLLAGLALAGFSSERLRRG